MGGQGFMRRAALWSREDHMGLSVRGRGLGGGRVEGLLGGLDDAWLACVAGGGGGRVGRGVGRVSGWEVDTIAWR